jgi:invasion protein IalB
MRRALSFFCVACVVLSFLVAGSDEALSAVEGKEKSEKFIGSGGEWQLLCEDKKKKETCRIHNRIFAEQEKDGKKKTVGNIASFSVAYLPVTKKNENTGEETEDRLPFMEVNVPLGVDLRGGGAVKIDGYTPHPYPYIRCLMTGCQMTLYLSDDLILQLQHGKKIFVVFNTLGNSTSTVGVSLEGFYNKFQNIR